ncbi:hypothetical protein L917_12742, partial [Phytophthora nicotianae]
LQPLNRTATHQAIHKSSTGPKPFNLPRTSSARCRRIPMKHCLSRGSQLIG